MAKNPKQSERDLVERLRGMGLRKPLAKNIAHAATSVKGQLPDSARTAIQEMLAKVEDLGGGVAKQRRPETADGDGQPATKAGTANAAKKSKKGKKGKKKKSS
jgi:cell division protein FtsI/penicillin-binding protein 2